MSYCLFAHIHKHSLVKLFQKPARKLLAENVNWFIDDQAFLLSYDLALPTILPLPPVSQLSLSLPLCRRSSLLRGEPGEGEGGEPDHRRQDSLVLYKKFNTLWLLVLLHSGRNMMRTWPQMKAYGKVSLDVYKKECNSLTERRGCSSEKDLRLS